MSGGERFYGNRASRVRAHRPARAPAKFRAGGFSGATRSLVYDVRGAALALAADRPQPEGRDRLREAAQRERPDRLAVDHVRKGRLGLRIEDDLARARVTAEPRGEVRHVADRGVFPALLEADHAEGRLALGDADAEADFMPEL